MGTVPPISLKGNKKKAFVLFARRFGIQESVGVHPWQPMDGKITSEPRDLDINRQEGPALG